MKITTETTTEIFEINIGLDYDGGKEVALSFLDNCGQLIRQVRTRSLKDALEYIKRQGGIND